MATQTENETDTETSYLLAQTFYIDLARFYIVLLFILIMYIP